MRVAAGLGVSYALQQLDVGHLVLERGTIAETWRRQRWDSFHMNTPNLLTVMPGDRYGGPDPEGAMSRDAFVALLEGYAARHRLPVHTGTTVIAMTATPDGSFTLALRDGVVRARAVVAASGSLNRPRRPAAAAAVPASVLQIDAVDYRNPSALPPGAVLVVGSAQSGAQISEELAAAGRTVYLATGAARRLPRRYRGRDIAIRLEQAGSLDVPRQEFVDAGGRVAGRPTLGALHTISLQSLSAAVRRPLADLPAWPTTPRFADDLRKTWCRRRRLGGGQAKIDAQIERVGIDAPPAKPDTAETVSPSLPQPSLRTRPRGGQSLVCRLVARARCGDFGRIAIPGALDAHGEPIHANGVSRCPASPFAGLDLPSPVAPEPIHAVVEEAPRFARADRPSRHRSRVSRVSQDRLSSVARSPIMRP